MLLSFPMHYSELLAMASSNELEGSRDTEGDTSMRDGHTLDEDMANADNLEIGEADLPELPEIELPPEVDNLHVNVAGVFHQLKEAYEALRSHTLLLHVEMKSEREKRVELEAQLREARQSSGKTIVVRDGLPDRQPNPFNGKGEIKSWLRDLEMLLNRKKEDSMAWVPYAVRFLEGNARQRWDRDYPEGAVLPTWGNFCKEMREKYKKEESVSAVLEKIAKLKQSKGNWIETLDDYVQRFENLWQKVGNERTSKDKVKMFLDGADPYIKDKCWGIAETNFDLTTDFEKMKDQASKVASVREIVDPNGAGGGVGSDEQRHPQKDYRNKSNYHPPPSDRGKGRAYSPTNNKRSLDSQPQQQPKREVPYCQNCHKRGHFTHACWNKRPRRDDGAGPSNKPFPNNRGNERPR